MNRHDRSWLLNDLAAVTLRAAAAKRNTDLTRIIFCATSAVIQYILEVGIDYFF